MEPAGTLEKAKSEGWTDEEIVARIRSGDTALYEIIMRRYNQRLYRVARAILRDDLEAEDVMQDAYVRAYEHLNQYAGRAAFSTWLTRIAVHEALARKRRSDRAQRFDDTQSEDGEPGMEIVARGLNPEQQAANTELSGLLEQAILELPDSYRVVLMLRDVEQLSTSETAFALDLSEENVKTRLHRSRTMVRKTLYARVGTTGMNAFTFMGLRCDRVVRGVFQQLEVFIREPGRVQ